MAFTDEHKAKFENLFESLKEENFGNISRQANGGRTVLFTYPPSEEYLYMKKMYEFLDNKNFQFIDIAKLLVEFIDLDGWEDFKEYYNDFSDTPHVVFSSDDEDTDLMKLIIREIIKASENGKTPVLIRTGSLHGTGIENQNIMEHKSVMNLKKPLVIFYPASIVGDTLMFLNFKPANKYRCTVIE